MELPLGWYYQNRDFTEKIGNEYRYFLNLWLDSRNKTTRERCGALKSFVLFLEDAMKLCKKKGKYFYFWFTECFADVKYLNQRKEELKYIEDHYDELLKQDEINEKKEKALVTLKADLLKIIISNKGILQTELYKMFDASLKNDISTELYYLCKDGYIVREKSGKTYKLFMKEG
ncbi:hypothetical protein ACQQ4G_003101 [Listeria monocytogenes]